MSAAAALPQLCLDYRKCKIAFVYSLPELKAGGAFREQQEGGWQREAAEQDERVCRARTCCTTAVKQIGFV
ncbi:hypothetical protein CesoFtcFv8_019553 [Champsocephalus esox]|uniref:Uncharacterized protein n=1 Tax=Champsocephalus esox TaxID=159716 RepID=A0AAN8GN92_9TELE|nr:hypothetical protein CesoFtcFv8_019553 [Champsocephalus esox]